MVYWYPGIPLWSRETASGMPAPDPVLKKDGVETELQLAEFSKLVTDEAAVVNIGLRVGFGNAGAGYR